MSLFESLAEEHALFRGLLRRLESCFLLPEVQGREAALSLLLDLVPALEGHEDLEHLVFSTAALGVPGLERLLEAQRVDLENLREDVAQAAQDEAGGSGIRLERLARLLSAKLEAHFLTEETLLWPKLSRAGGRSTGATLEGRVRRKLAELQEDIASRKARLESRMRLP